MRWLIGVVVALAAIGALFWWSVLDARPPAEAADAFDLVGYRALVADDAAETLPTQVRVAFIGASTAPSFAADAGNFSGQRTFAYVSFDVVAPGGNTIIDGAVDQDTLDQMTKGEGQFSADTYAQVLDAMPQASRVMITHEHLDHVMAIARHPDPAALAPRLLLTRAQIDGLPQHAPNGVLAPEIAALQPLDLATPQRIAPGIVAAAAPGHSPGSIVIYVRGAEHEYLFIGDIVWAMSALEHLTGRPRFIHWIMSGVDPDRDAVLRQIRALHDLAAANPDLVILPAHDDAYIRQRIADGSLVEGFAAH